MILIVSAGAAILALLILFAPKEFVVERDVLVHRPRNTVFGFLKQVQKQELWNPWTRRDPELHREYRGQDGTVGFVYSWSGKTAGAGEQEIRAIDEGSRIDFELRFEKPFRATNQAFLTTHAAQGNATRVTWGLAGRMPFPMNVLHLFMKGRLSRDLDEGLALLKEVLET